MVPGRLLGMFALLALLAGCLETRSDAALRVVNETDSPATVDLAVFDRNGVPVHHDRIAVAARSVAEGAPLSLPEGEYSVQARTDRGLEVQQLLQVVHGSAVKVWLAADGDQIGLAII